jgi:hypothetical protein
MIFYVFLSIWTLYICWTPAAVNITQQSQTQRYCRLVAGELEGLNSARGSPWVYRNSIELKNAPYAGQLGVYKGGGYSAPLRYNRRLFWNL